MKDVEKLFEKADFSKYTDLKDRLSQKLFSSTTSQKITRGSYESLSEDDLEFVNAAQGLYPDKDPFNNH